MLLAIDAGNTNIVFALYDGDKMRAQWRAVTQVSRTSDEYAVWLSQLLALEGLSFKDLNQAIIATVVPAVLFDLRALCRTYLKCEPMLVGDPALDMGMKANVDRPQSVGADRLCNTVAAHERYPGAVIVVVSQWCLVSQSATSSRSSMNHRAATSGPSGSPDSSRASRIASRRDARYSGSKKSARNSSTAIRLPGALSSCTRWKSSSWPAAGR